VYARSGYTGEREGTSVELLATAFLKPATSSGDAFAIHACVEAINLGSSVRPHSACSWSALRGVGMSFAMARMLFDAGRPVLIKGPVMRGVPIGLSAISLALTERAPDTRRE
jgi:hypothetical protein